MKKILAAVLASALALSLAACGASPGSGSGGTTGGKAPEKITVWHIQPEDTEETSYHQRLLKWAEEFNAEHPDIQVEVSGAKTLDVILTTIAGGDTPDIFENNWNMAPSWADKGAILDLTDYVNNDTEWNKDDFFDAAWELCTYNDRIYSVPRLASTTVMTYRPDLLAEAGWDHFPENTDELLQCAIDCTKLDENGNIVQMGFIPDYYWLDNVLWPAAFGASWMDGDQPNFNNDRIIAAYEFQKKIFDEFGYDNVRRFVDTFGHYATTEDPLFKGKVAMHWAPCENLDEMSEYGEGIDWKLAPMPIAPDGQGGQMLSCGVWEVNAKTKYPDSAWEVLSSLTSAETQKFLAEGDFNNGAYYSRKSALEYVVNELDVDTAVKETASIFLNEKLYHFPMLSYTNEYLDAINVEMVQALMGNTTVEDAAAKVQEQMEAIANG